MRKVLLIIALLAFGGCCCLYGGYSDMVLVRAIHTGRKPAWDPAFRFISNTTALISFALVLPYLLGYAVRRKKEALTAGSLLLCSLLLATGLVQALKFLVHRPRPFEVYSFVQKLSDGGGGSFPSGHTTDAFTVLAFFMLIRSRWLLVLPIVGWALTIGYSRIVLGVHYGSDVLGAMLLGIFAAWFTRFIAIRYGPVRQHVNHLSKNITD